MLIATHSYQLPAAFSDRVIELALDRRAIIFIITSFRQDQQAAASSRADRPPFERIIFHSKSIRSTSDDARRRLLLLRRVRRRWRAEKCARPEESMEVGVAHIMHNCAEAAAAAAADRR